MPDEWWSDDDRLLATLEDAVSSAQAVPSSFLAAGKAVYAWRTIDAELADLTYDSAADPELLSAIRAESATLRALTFASAGLTIEIEVTPEELLGQISPVQAGQVTAYAVTAEASGSTEESSGLGTAVIDDLGFFVIRPLPAEAFRLLCRTASGTTVLTGLISL
jgi:hypothetical protein